MNNREIDALVAEKVMGCHVYVERRASGSFYRCDCMRYDGTLRLCPHSHSYIDDALDHYTEDIAAAWLVIEKMRTMKYYIRMGVWGSENDTSFWFCRFERGGLFCSSEYAKFMPLAICLSALKAVGVEMGE